MITDDAANRASRGKGGEGRCRVPGAADSRGPHREGWLRSYGRRRGRRPSARQAELLARLLPRVAVSLDQPAPARLADLFDAPVEDVWLEVGFGGGEHLLWQARHHPSVGIIGCEPFRDGIIKVLAAIDAEGLGNLRLYADDVRPLFAWLPQASVARAFVLFPDPWPKKRHHKRRLLTTATFALFAHILRPAGEVRIATDHAAYAAAILEALHHQGDFADLSGLTREAQRPDDWPATRYEEKARRAGRACRLISLRRR
jgi:tRNA (guanine-N7-)-methyltransferase